MEYAAIYKAYKKCAKGKRKSSQCQRFQNRLGQELFLLHKELNNNTYKPSAGRCFVVVNPKVREIWASTFRDRVVHHLIVEPLEKIWEPRFHPKSFACRKGKGLHAAIEDFKKQVRRLSQGGMVTVWALKVDIASFFFTVDRDILKKLFLQEARDQELVQLIEKLFSFDPRSNFKRVGDLSLFAKIPKEKTWQYRAEKQGMPIGNLTSQFGANLYLNDLDQFVSRKLKPKGYLRYMDDLTLLDTDPAKLRLLEGVIDNWLLRNRKQRLNPTKTVLTRLTKGIEYLGFYLKQTGNAKEPLLVLPQPSKKWKFVQEARRLARQDIEPLVGAHDLSFPLHHESRQELQKLNSRLGLMTHTSSYKLRRKTLRKLKQVFRVEKPDVPLSVHKKFKRVRL